MQWGSPRAELVHNWLTLLTNFGEREKERDTALCDDRAVTTLLKGFVGELWTLRLVESKSLFIWNTSYRNDPDQVIPWTVYEKIHQMSHTFISDELSVYCSSTWHTHFLEKSTFSIKADVPRATYRAEGGTEPPNRSVCSASSRPRQCRAW